MRQLLFLVLVVLTTFTFQLVHGDETEISFDEPTPPPTAEERALFQASKARRAQRDLSGIKVWENHAGARNRLYRNNLDGVPQSLRGKFIHDWRDVIEHKEELADLLGFVGTEEFRIFEVDRVPGKAKRVMYFQQYINGIPIHTARRALTVKLENGHVKSVRGYAYLDNDPSTQPALSSSDAVQIALDHASKMSKRIRIDTSGYHRTSPVYLTGKSGLELGWRVELTCEFCYDTKIPFIPIVVGPNGWIDDGREIHHENPTRVWDERVVPGGVPIWDSDGTCGNSNFCDQSKYSTPKAAADHTDEMWDAVRGDNVNVGELDTDGVTEIVVDSPEVTNPDAVAHYDYSEWSTGSQFGDYTIRYSEIHHTDGSNGVTPAPSNSGITAHEMGHAYTKRQNPSISASGNGRIQVT